MDKEIKTRTDKDIETRTDKDTETRTDKGDIHEEINDDFDESDIFLMEHVSELVSMLAQTFFQMDGLEMSAEPVHILEDEQIMEFLELIEYNLDAYYRKHVGVNWIVDKEEEIQEPGLVYVSYRKNGGLVGFMSFKLCVNEGHKVLYLYEIHVHPKFQGQRHGCQWILRLHEFCGQMKGEYLEGTSGTELTVFPSNTRAVEWYKRLGYVLTKESPRDKILRDRVIQPDVYLMERIEKEENERKE